MSTSNSSNFASSTSEAMSRFHGSVRKAFTGYYRTKDFIRRIRACKTASDERSLVARESAAIRDSFKKPQCSREQRYHSLAKLVYIHLLGYAAQFGQVECIKLAAGQVGRGRDKRLGYLGVSLLSDEHQDVLTLLTNSLKFDLAAAGDEASQALALSTLALVASPEMALELADEVDRLLQAPTANIRKRATVAATKLIQKEPEIAELFHFNTLSALLLNQKQNHSVILGALNLLQTILKTSSVNYAPYIKLLPSLVKILASLQTSPLDTEYDISGVSDPLLQIALLRTIRILACLDSASPDNSQHNSQHNSQLNSQHNSQHNSQLNSQLQDLLAQLATTLDSSKNVGNAVQYEVVLTIMALPHIDNSLVNLAIGTLGRFLTGNACGDNNLRYVALNLLTRIIVLSGKPPPITTPSTNKTFENHSHLPQILRHQSTILACLHDADSTIRKKAADLALLCISSQENLAQIAPELLALATREAEISSSDIFHHLLDKLAAVIRKHARDPIIFSNLSINLLKLLNAKHPAKNEIVTQFIKHSISSSHLSKHHIHLVRELYFALTILHEEEEEDQNSDNSAQDISDSMDKNGLIISTDSLLMDKRKVSLPSEGLLEVSFWFFGEFGHIVPLESLCSASELVDLLAAFLKPTKTDPSVSLYALSALAKLTTRLPIDQIEPIKAHLTDAHNCYIQSNQFELLDRVRQLLAIISNSATRKIAFEPLNYSKVSDENSIDKDYQDDSSSFTSSPSDQIENDLTTTNATLVPDLLLDKINVFIDQSQVTTPTSLQLQLYFKNAGPESLSNVSIALAVPRGFDFDYLSPASGTELAIPQDQISLSILIKKLPKDPTDLLQFASESESVDWNASCKVKIKAAYTIGNETHQQIGQFLHILL
jgi:hypothetical protein